MSEMAKILAVGMIVYLKSGSPRLTVSLLERADIVEVDWFDGAEVKRDGFHPDQLTLDDPSMPDSMIELSWSKLK